MIEKFIVWTNMHGYAAYVWSAYAIFVASLYVQVKLAKAGDREIVKIT
jgi:heme exporter protein CcmD